MSGFIEADKAVTGSGQDTLGKTLEALIQTVGIVGDDLNGAAVGGATTRFNNPSAGPFTDRLAGFNGAAILTLLHAIDQLPDVNLTSGNLPTASGAVSVPMNGNSLTFDQVNSFVVVADDVGKTSTFQIDTLVVETQTPGACGQLRFRPQKVNPEDVIFDTVISGHPSATGEINLQLPAVLGAGGVLVFDFLGRSIFGEFTVSNAGTGEAIHAGTAFPLDLTLKKIKSVGGTIAVTTDGDGALNIESLSSSGRNRGVFAKAKDTTGNAWPTINDGTIAALIGQAFNDFDEFTIEVTGDTGGDSFEITDGVTPVTVFNGDKLILVDSAAPTVTASWNIIRQTTPIADTNCMTHSLVNATGQDKLHDNNGHDHGYTNVAAWSISAATHGFTTTAGLTIQTNADGSVTFPQYAAGAFDDTPVKNFAFNSSNKLVTVHKTPKSWIRHKIQLDEEFAADAAIKLDGTTLDTTLLIDGSLDWTAWPDQASIAADPYFQCLSDTDVCDLDAQAGSQLSMIRPVADDEVRFNQIMAKGTQITWKVPVY